MPRMAETVGAVGRPQPRYVRLAAATAAGIAAAAGVVMALLLLDRVVVVSRQELDRVTLGMPLSWVTQEQHVDPSLPVDVGLLSPWEHPTAIAWTPLTANLALVALVLALAWAGLRALRAST